MQPKKDGLKCAKGIIVFLMSLFVLGAIFNPPLFAQSAEDRILLLNRTIEDLNFDDYVDHRLFVKLGVVQNSLERGNYKPAVNNLHTFKKKWL